LLLVKHVAASMPLEELTARGIVDPAFPRFVKESGVRNFVLGAADHAMLADAKELA
jgi:hypothetical protein